MTKSDADAIKRFLERLARETWLGPSRTDWPLHSYHITTVQNAAEILKAGRILSRAALRADGVAFQDCADREVIANSEWSHGFARLYFRPKTPTQYHMEGISPPHVRRHGAHVPVPVFFLFDAPELYCEDGVQFSNGNMAAAGHDRGGGAAFLTRLDFKKIYHEGPLADGPAKAQIIFMRCAEILVPGELPLTHLNEVVCRTAPERDTLLAYLGTAAEPWREVIRIERPAELFYRRWHYVRDIRWDGRRVFVNLSRVAPQRRLVYRFRDGGSGVMTQPVSVTGNQEEYAVVSTDPRIAVEYTVYDSVAYRGYLSQRQVFT